MRTCAERVAFPAAHGVLLAALVACGAPDRPPGRVPGLPQEAIEFLDADSARGLRLGEGVFYRFAWSARGPWAVHTVSADLARCELGLRVVPALEEDGIARTRRTVTEMVPRGMGRPLAGVNGDFFILEGGAPVGSGSHRLHAPPFRPSSGGVGDVRGSMDRGTGVRRGPDAGSRPDGVRPRHRRPGGQRYRMLPRRDCRSSGATPYS